MAPKYSKLNLPPALLANETQPEAVRPKCTPESDALAAELFDAALTAAGIETAEVAYLFQCSESLVRRMRSKDAREGVSFRQMLLLPMAFHLELHRVMNKKFGFGRAALIDLLEAAGRLAVVIG